MRLRGGYLLRHAEKRGEHLKRIATRAEARVADIDYAEGCCNRRCPCSIVGYRVPAGLMDEFLERVGLAFATKGKMMPLAAKLRQVECPKS